MRPVCFENIKDAMALTSLCSLSVCATLLLHRQSERWR